MDWYSTALDLAGIEEPTDRIIDGISLVPLFKKGVETNRTIFFYRGNEMMAVRNGQYKAHYWTWTNSLDEFNKVIVLLLTHSMRHTQVYLYFNFLGDGFLSWRGYR